MSEEYKFEWDSDKAATNLAKHGVSFETARKVFYVYPAFDISDTRYDYGEDRRILMGMVEGRLLVVVYTMRNEVIRIISVWEAKPYERRKFWKFFDL